MILSICDSADVQEVMSLLSTLVKVICIAVPILLIISLMISFTKAITDKNGEGLSNVSKSLISKVIAAILVFFIPTFVRIIANITLTDTEYEACLNIRTLKEIEISREAEIDGKIDKLKRSMSNTDYNDVKADVNSLSDGEVKDKYLKELDKIKNELDLQYSVDNALKYGGESEYNELYPKVEALDSGSFKNSLREKLSKLKERIDDEKSRLVNPPAVN